MALSYTLKAFNSLLSSLDIPIVVAGIADLKPSLLRLSLEALLRIRLELPILSTSGKTTLYNNDLLLLQTIWTFVNSNSPSRFDASGFVNGHTREIIAILDAIIQYSKRPEFQRTSLRKAQEYLDSLSSSTSSFPEDHTVNLSKSTTSSNYSPTRQRTLGDELAYVTRSPSKDRIQLFVPSPRKSLRQILHSANIEASQLVKESEREEATIEQTPRKLFENELRSSRARSPEKREFSANTVHHQRSQTEVPPLEVRDRTRNHSLDVSSLRSQRPSPLLAKDYTPHRYRAESQPEVASNYLPSSFQNLQIADDHPDSSSCCSGHSRSRNGSRYQVEHSLTCSQSTASSPAPINQRERPREEDLSFSGFENSDYASSVGSRHLRRAVPPSARSPVPSTTYRHPPRTPSQRSPSEYSQTVQDTTICSHPHSHADLEALPQTPKDNTLLSPLFGPTESRRRAPRAPSETGSYPGVFRERRAPARKAYSASNASDISVESEGARTRNWVARHTGEREIRALPHDGKRRAERVAELDL